MAVENAKVAGLVLDHPCYNAGIHGFVIIIKYNACSPTICISLQIYFSHLDLVLSSRETSSPCRSSVSVYLGVCICMS